MAAPVIARPPALHILRPDPLVAEVRKAVDTYKPTTPLARLVRRAVLHLPPDLAAELLEHVAHTLVVQSTLSLVVIHGKDGRREELGVVGRKVVTTAGVNYIVGYLTGSNSGGNFKYHGLGTGTNAEAIGDTALQTELTTEYGNSNTRATGTSVVGSSNNIYQTVATNTLDSGTPAVTEAGVFSASSSGTLLDRFKFSAINLVGANGDALQTTVNITFAAGG